MSDEKRLETLEADLYANVTKTGQLAVDVKGVQDDLEATNETLGVLADAVEGLVRQDVEDKKPPFCWLTYTDLDEQNKAIERLDRFMVQVVGHYPDGILNDCWRRHPIVVEQLLVLEELFTQGYSPKAKDLPGIRADFWDRWMPNAMTRIKRMLGDCSLTAKCHNDENEYTHPEQVGLDDFYEFDDAWRARHGTTMPFAPSDRILNDSRRRNEDDGRARYDM